MTVPDTWAAAVGAYQTAPGCHYSDCEEGCCDDCVALGLRAALPHLLEAVVGEMEPQELTNTRRVHHDWSLDEPETRAALLAALQRSAARLTDE